MGDTSGYVYDKNRSIKVNIATPDFSALIPLQVFTCCTNYLSLVIKVNYTP